MNRLFLDVHALQTVPPSNLNRDDTGAPKSAVYGGVPRSRVSSQAWKRATRSYFEKQDLLDPGELGVRTKKVAEVLAARITAVDPALDEAAALLLAATVIQTATGSKIEPPKRKADAAKDGDDGPAPESKYLMFLSSRQLDGLAALAVDGAADIKAYLQDKANKARAKEIANTRHSVDIALFGRMVADSADFNVDAAVQVAHAISVHRVDTESDYYTAVDDKNSVEETGAGMIGTVDFNSATLYRYAALNVHQLAGNLGGGLRDDEARSTPVRRAVEAFVQSFLESLPTGKINTFGHHTVPDAVIVKLRTTRPMSYVAAFEEAVTGTGGYLREAVGRLAEYVPDVEQKYGDEGTTVSWVLRVGPATEKLSGLGTEQDRIEDLVRSVGQAVAERLDKPA
ncbi:MULTISPECIES: type I-E CRISPR-associated protein Cas7/Cse4/CasC [Streptomyces]|uniref:Type I-E CRISPR-associated protein Cas7/Cse4/CasC n=1 Tax=Streptomyces tsukubensis (strain DSM 42081 / NBRC 108919 / NRRL 18488 / 9993) TaxID=1114943 RepID=I2NBH7_STRT9|nr:type I-E CRISPR-associated protein Cas7/Cse4/CasC [Streptomyces tsukubensis]MYS68061.1 type I-E CRISPR-associated protein Cas7/Cse4/CasC [Streptomyces sp. SID5473]AZK98094.1 type I-E CRISPR-associated protein Cas7/Cse4/CasC [Streptomyces tsukubensis]EIF94374.1 CRISPR-associated protein, Cse4 family [Streptomyces tsukubensis NRRL18488]QKM65982.1 type I-E CRISPR-associated protein Cas7/Cse4/CasC [Streptomyces tsukubensis NRRL18488]TAI42266.1 type I-E CRISPR-associated protein Cas7/Cse4/CasC [